MPLLEDVALQILEENWWRQKKDKFTSHHIRHMVTDKNPTHFITNVGIYLWIGLKNRKT